MNADEYLAFSPDKLQLTGWWKNFAGGTTWARSPSAGSSASRSLVTTVGKLSPTISSLGGGKTSAIYAHNSSMEVTGGLKLSDFIGVGTTYSFWAIVRRVAVNADWSAFTIFGDAGYYMYTNLQTEEVLSTRTQHNIYTGVASSGYYTSAITPAQGNVGPLLEAHAGVL